MPLKSDMFESGESASRLKRDQERRREAARKRRLEEEKVARRVAEAQEATRAEAERRRKEAEAREAREARRARLEARRTGGIAWSAQLRARPLAANGDRVELPASALAQLEQLNAFDDAKPITFELRMVAADATMTMNDDDESNDDDDDDEEEEEPFARVPSDATHAGVAAFVAEEGYVGLPPKTMLSLARGDPAVAKALDGGEALVQVKFVRLPVVAESRASLRPLAGGFFRDEEDSIDVDVKAVLEREFRGRQTALTAGDWLAVDLEGGSGTVRFRVEELLPFAALNVLNTDLEVVVLPSERVEADARREQRAKAQSEANALRRRQRADDARSRLSVQPQQSGSDVIRVQLRFADGHRAEDRFAARSAASVLADLADAHADDDARLDAAADWALVSTYPRKTYRRADLAGLTLAPVAAGQASVALLVLLSERILPFLPSVTVIGRGSLL